MLQQIALAATVFLAASISRAAAHGNLISPLPEGDSDHIWYFGGPAGTIDMPEIVGSASYGDYYEAVDDWFTENDVYSVKEYFTKYGSDVAECGITKKDGTPRAVPSDGYALHDNLGSSHPGPCEIWCDDTRVFHDTNCASKFAGQAPAKIPIDVSTCKSSSELVFYWLALHAQPWQVYINCVALDGSAASSANSTHTAAPSPDTSIVDEASEEITEAPAATKAPTPTPAPSTSSSKCLRRHS
jgi:hypothetical protein